MPRSATFALLLLTVPALAQDPLLPPAPVPVSPPPILGRPMPLPQAVRPSPLAYDPPPPGPVIGPGVVAPPLDPGPNGWGPLGSTSKPPGFYALAEVAYVFPGLKFRVSNDVPLPNSGLILNVPSVSLDNTISPVFEIGYDLGESVGQFSLAYSFLFAEGNGSATNNMGTFETRTRAQVNWIDLDYGMTFVDAVPHWDVSYRLGARILDVYLDSRGTRTGLTQEASSEFFGGGLHARLDVERRILPLPGVALFGRLDGALFVGQIDQDFTATVGGRSDSFSTEGTQTVPYLNLQAGVSYAPPALPGLKVTAGYLFEDYFNVGRLGANNNGVSNSRGELWWHGAFVRGQFDF